jgi:hypothetical protein
MGNEVRAIQVAAGAVWKLQPQLQDWPHGQQQHNSTNNNRMLGSDRARFCMLEYFIVKALGFQLAMHGTS